VPLPGAASSKAIPDAHDENRGGTPHVAEANRSEPVNTEAGTPTPALEFELPDLSGLWEDEETAPSSAHEEPLTAREEPPLAVPLSVPSLPDLEDLFDAPQPPSETAMATPNLPDLDELF
jgi:hypothetical protein